MWLKFWQIQQNFKWKPSRKCQNRVVGLVQKTKVSVFSALRPSFSIRTKVLIKAKASACFPTKFWNVDGSEIFLSVKFNSNRQIESEPNGPNVKNQISEIWKYILTVIDLVLISLHRWICGGRIKFDWATSSRTCHHVCFQHKNVLKELHNSRSILQLIF